MTFPSSQAWLSLTLSLLLLALFAPGCGENGGLGGGEICGDGQDNDGDTYRDCDIPELIDCDDENSDVNPAAPELCDSVDNDCDGEIDNVDADGDGYISSDCYGSDCDDSDPDAYPGRPESCDGADNDCDGEVDNGFDADNDGWTSCTGDCNNSDPYINPAAEELCDLIDNDCDNDVDEDFDVDEDGFIGWDGPEYAACADLYGPGGEAADRGDCDDADDDQWPGAHESPDNGEDDDCDGCVDECQDGDGDGWDNCSAEHPGDPTCDVPGESGPSVDGLDADCDDCADPTNIDCLSSLYVHPDITFQVLNNATGEYQTMDEICDGVDNDCDGETDEGFDPITCDPL